MEECTQDKLNELLIIQQEKGVFWTVAKEIMGRNFFSSQEVLKHFGISLTEKEFKKVERIPFSKELLQGCKDTHILFLGVPHDEKGNSLTINRFREMFPADQQPCFWLYSGSWHDKEKFSTVETPELRWYLIRKSILKESRSKNYD